MTLNALLLCSVDVLLAYVKSLPPYENTMAISVTFCLLQTMTLCRHVALDCKTSWKDCKNTMNVRET